MDEDHFQPTRCRRLFIWPNYTHCTVGSSTLHPYVNVRTIILTQFRSLDKSCYGMTFQWSEKQSLSCWPQSKRSLAKINKLLIYRYMRILYRKKLKCWNYEPSSMNPFWYTSCLTVYSYTTKAMKVTANDIYFRWHSVEDTDFIIMHRVKTDSYCGKQYSMETTFSKYLHQNERHNYEKVKANEYNIM